MASAVPVAPAVMWSAVAERSGDTAFPGDESCHAPPDGPFPGNQSGVVAAALQMVVPPQPTMSSIPANPVLSWQSRGAISFPEAPRRAP